MNKNISRSSLLAFLFLSCTTQADQRIQDDLVVTGSLCTGFDCASGEVFGFDTIRLKENNLRIRFIDTSSSSGFPTTDWQITANDSANGGANYFAVEDLDSATVPFYIRAASPNHSIYVNNTGNVGFGTSAPAMRMHATNGNTPTLRLEQDASGGWGAQTWDVGANETNFFVRDVTNSGRLPLRIRAGAPNASIYVDTDGDVGFETTTPDGQFDVAHSTDANNHAFLISPTSNVGVNIDNGFLPTGLFDVQTTGGKSQLVVQSDGKVGINVDNGQTPNNLFDIQTSGGASLFTVESNGDVAIGTNSFDSRFEILDRAGSNSLLRVYDSGVVRFGTDWQITANAGGNFKLERLGTPSPKIKILANGSIVIGAGLTVSPTGDVTVNNLTVVGTCTGC